MSSGRDGTVSPVLFSLILVRGDEKTPNSTRHVNLGDPNRKKLSQKFVGFHRRGDGEVIAMCLSKAASLLLP